jgi:hypothetical protein
MPLSLAMLVRRRAQFQTTQKFAGHVIDGIDTLTRNIRPKVLDWRMKPISYASLLPPDVIRHAV